ncbi:type II toxin-antitoxin system RelE/ParE family toxin [Pseudolabrys sp. FHR47]|uniref:type II toxin-antitoxin system RelE/ParE family toxin n=1 Tax=Pseudolabrys sp. FHR47 TaxID=2562284 RepID=UPI0010BE5255|nr:type II toxin-antitoxin system RelE/ParE family toxin [Pseudolabrys sp. FHR47]
MKVRFTPNALADLDAIRSYISQFNPPAAGRVIALIEQIALRLGEFPEAGQPSDHPGVRVIFSRRYSYHVYYRIEAVGVVILQIRHAARRPLKPTDL